MKTKHFITIAALMLFILTGLATQAGELVYIRVVLTSPKHKVYIYERGNVTESSIPSGIAVGKHAEEIAPFMEIIEKYNQLGFKLISSVATSWYKEYTFEKQ